MFLKTVTAIVLPMLICSGCNKLVDVNVPSNRITSGSAYSADATAAAVITGIYTKLASAGYTTVTIPTISMWSGLSADEFALWSSSSNNTQIAYFKNNLSGSTSSNVGSEFWASVYPIIYSCNAAIEGLNNSSTLTPAVKKQLIGEAKFLRSLFYFYLVNLFGDVPLALTTNYTINSVLPRSAKTKVYQQIIEDLKDAQASLDDRYLQGDAITPYSSLSVTERVRPNKTAATALLAKVYLFTADFQNAETQASAVINNSSLYKLVPLNNVFLKNSMEAIWQLQPVSTGNITNTADAVQFVLTYAPSGLGTGHPVYLSSSLLNSFELGDQRKVNGNWMNVYTDISGTYYYPYKYKDVTIGTGVKPTEYTMMLRLGEQYLIRSEARAQLGNLNGALSDLDSIRLRAKLAKFPISTQADILKAILHERQVELFTELGNRWFDIKRTNSVDTVMNKAALIKGTTWKSYQQLYPVPVLDISKNYQLVQNDGY